MDKMIEKTRILFLRLKSGFMRKLLYFLGIGAIGFVFEACYGVPPDGDLNLHYQLKGKIQTSEGEAAARVPLLATSSSEERQTVTGQDGTYILSIDGHVADRVTISLPDGKDQATVVLPADDRTVEVEVLTIE